MKKIIIAILAGIVGIGITFHALNTLFSPDPDLPQGPFVQSNTESKTFKYSGEDGKNALGVLQSKTTIEQDNSGLVTSINNVKANPSAREYWAFYINGEMAQVGPQGYITKDTDKIEWKLETY